MSGRVLVLTVAFAGVAAVALAQQPLRLQIAGGRVTLHAQNVPVRTILAEWSRLGGARVVNGDRVAGAPVTLDFDNVPERQALDILLRGVSGYMLAAREAGATGASMFDRIMILPTSAAPRNPPAASAASVPVLGSPTAGLIRPIAPRVPDDPDSDATDVAAGDNDGVPIARPVTVQRPTAVAGAPLFPPPPIANSDDPPPAAPQPGVVVTPSNPFGLPPGSSSRPGEISPAPQSPSQTPPPNNRQN